ncbi:MAG: hypothetical protein WDN76_03215 [Alphaproteobacteria bacterium]
MAGIKTQSKPNVERIAFLVLALCVWLAGLSCTTGPRRTDRQVEEREPPWAFDIRRAG